MDSLYNSFKGKSISLKDKVKYKHNLIQKILLSTDSLFQKKSNFINFNKKISQKFNNNLPNNAYFIGYQTYRSKQDFFKDEFNSQFKGNLKQYLIYLKKKYPSSLVFGF